MRLHIVGLPHTQISREWSHCAYTQKILKFCKMMGKEHEINVYAPDGPPIEGATLQPCTLPLRKHNRLPNWPSPEVFVPLNEKAIQLIRAAAQPRDLLLLIGTTHAPIAHALPDMRCIEPFVGYDGIFTNFCAFESHAWRSHVYGMKGIHDGRWYDTVIPNYFDPDEFHRLNDGEGKYLLFLGRCVQRKGIWTALEIAEAAGMPLVVAGAGVTKHKDGKYLEAEGARKHGDVYYYGSVGIKDRAELLAGARALLAPTSYIEPFGGVAVEAMFAGTPAITTDWGAFPETVTSGVTGYRIHNMRDALCAVRNAEKLVPARVRAFAQARYSLDKVGFEFDAWFRRIADLWGKGWYEL